MTADTVATSDARGWHLITRVRAWKVWGLRRPALAFLVAVEALALTLTVTAFAQIRWDSDSFGRLILLLSLSIVYTELTHQMYRMRLYLGTDRLVELYSVWVFAAVIVLPVGYMATLVIGAYTYAGVRRSQQRTTPHRHLYSGAVLLTTAIVADLIASQLQPQLAQLPSGPMTAVAVAVATVAFLVINLALIAIVIRLAAGPLPIKQLLPARDEIALDFSTLVLGVLTAEMVRDLVWLTPAVLILMMLLQRSSLVSQLQVAATTDTKTGLLNATAWQELAQRELLRARRDESPCAVMLLDLDHFKLVNDTLGHLSGDRALKAVADGLKKELRGYDAVARFGGEEFVVFLNDLQFADARQVAERTLERVRGVIVTGQDPDGPYCTLTASIGLASYPEHGTELTDLLEAADVALYGAKRDGRDRVGEPRWGIEEPVSH
jgi:diguanylate cyclase (GGDEF)-like protein